MEQELLMDMVVLFWRLSSLLMSSYYEWLEVQANPMKASSFWLWIVWVFKWEEETTRKGVNKYIYI